MLQGRKERLPIRQFDLIQVIVTLHEGFHRIRDHETSGLILGVNVEIGIYGTHLPLDPNHRVENLRLPSQTPATYARSRSRHMKRGLRGEWLVEFEGLELAFPGLEE